ncbi:MAG: NosD domain-containing protein, partial [Candidatus Altiarchaeota archaeon]|nr:NosD domain-containing protein [Candidatus Altiarchaeota archaeon]
FILGDCTTYCSSCGDCSAAIKTANPGDVICLDSNITNASTSFCINVSTNNITFSCQGNRVDGNHSAMPFSGIYIQRDLKQETNVTVRDCRLSDWENGDIYLWNVEGVLLQNIIQEVSSGSGDNGIHLNNASFNTLHNISAENNSYGIYLTENSSHNNLVNVRTRFNDWGVYMNNSKGNNLTNATLRINGFDGVYMENSNQSTLINVLSEYNEWYGIYLESCSGNTFCNINLSWNNRSGLFIHESGYNNFTNVTTENNNLTGIFLLNASYNSFREVYSGGNNLYGILLEADSEHNTIRDSWFMANSVSGLFLKINGISDPDLNQVYNCFFNNTLNVKIDDSIGAENYFNISIHPGSNIAGGSNVSGNYWSTPAGDGFSEVCNNTDDNSFCDEPYNLSNGSSIAVDWLPLTQATTTAVDGPPTVSLVYPPDNYVNDSSDPVNISFTCLASDNHSLVNLTLYIWNSSGSLFVRDNVSVSSSNISSTWNISLRNGNYTWNCLAFDNNSQQDWGDGNYTLRVNYSETSLISVSACWFNESSVLQGVSVRVSENVSFGVNPLSSCWFDVNGSVHNYTDNTTDTFWFLLDTSLMYGNYTLTCYANDTGYDMSSMTGGQLEVVAPINESNISVSACWFNESSVLQGVSVRVSENVSPGVNLLSDCWFDVNGSIYDYMDNDSDTFWFLLDTSSMYGNYSLTCYANDTGYDMSSMTGGQLEVVAPINESNISVSACWFNESSVLQGVGVRVSENVSLGVNPLSSCWFDVNGSVHNYTDNTTDTFWFLLDTSLMYGNYSLTCYANDTGYDMSSMTGGQLEVVTTTTTTTTHTTTTTSGGGNGGGGGGSAPPPTREGSCFDGLLNCHHGSCEEDTDCGGPCTPCVSCSDGIQNQGEEGVDCGGPCTPCVSCSDGIQNQGEEGVDCGGPCSPCPSCSDGIRNQGEEGVDCGGPCRECTKEERKRAEESGEAGGGTIPGGFIEASCFDGLRNQGEEDIDCGGPCVPCSVNRSLELNTSIPRSIERGALFVLYVRARAEGSDITNVSAKLTVPETFNVINSSTCFDVVEENKSRLFSWTLKSNRSIETGNYTAFIEFNSNELKRNLTTSLNVVERRTAETAGVANEVRNAVYGFVERVYETIISEPSAWVLLSFSLLLLVYAYHRIRTRRV